MRYKTLMIDVPSPNGMTSKRTARPNQGNSLPYKTMSWEEIRNFPINEFADKECLMFFWTTDKFIVEAHKTIEEWGFKKHCIFVWNKPTGVVKVILDRLEKGGVENSPSNLSKEFNLSIQEMFTLTNLISVGVFD